MPPQRETFRHTASATAAVSEPGSAAVSSIATRTATRSRTARIAAIAVDGLLDELEAGGREARRCRATASSTLPRPVGVEAQLHLRPGRGAHRGDPPGVVADADLDLHARVARARRVGGRRGGARAVLGRDRRVDADARRRLVGDELADRAALAVARRGPTARGRPRRAPGGGRRRRGRRRAARRRAGRRRRGGSARRPRARRGRPRAARRRRARAARPRPSRRPRRRRGCAAAAARARTARRRRSAAAARSASTSEAIRTSISSAATRSRAGRRTPSWSMPVRASARLSVGPSVWARTSAHERHASGQRARAAAAATATARRGSTAAAR